MNTSNQPSDDTAPITRAEFTAFRELLAETLRNMVWLMDNINVPGTGADYLGKVNKLIYQLENDVQI